MFFRAPHAGFRICRSAFPSAYFRFWTFNKLYVTVPKAELSTGKSNIPIFQPVRAINGLQCPSVKHNFSLHISLQPAFYKELNITLPLKTRALQNEEKKFSCPSLRKKLQDMLWSEHFRIQFSFGKLLLDNVIIWIIVKLLKDFTKLNIKITYYLT